MTPMMSALIKGAIFVLLLFACAFMVRSMRHFDPMGKIRKQMEEWERKKLLEGAKLSDGLMERAIEKLDRNLTQAGIKRYVPKATAELFILLCSAEFVAVFLCLKKGILLPLAAGAFVVYLNFLLTDILRFTNRKRTENHLMPMLCNISDLSMTESEITMILYRTGQMMPYPLKDALMKCHLTSRGSGDTKKAFYELRRSIHHPLFSEIILLLELAAQNNSDYIKVVDGCRGMVHRYLKEEKEKMTVAGNLLMEAGVMILIAIYGISTMVYGFAADAGVTGGLKELFFQNPVGQICFILFVLLFLGMVQVIFQFAKR